MVAPTHLRPVFEFLQAVQERPGMFFVEEARDAQLRGLERLLWGFERGLAVAGQPSGFTEKFRTFVHEKNPSWSMAQGVVTAILSASESGEAAWDAWWLLVQEYRVGTAESMAGDSAASNRPSVCSHDMRVVLTGWREGMRKIDVTKTIAERAGYGLAEAKACTDAVLEGRLVTIRGFAVDEALRLRDLLEDLGVIAEVRRPQAT